MGLGGGPSEWDEYEWFCLADVPPEEDEAGPDPFGEALRLLARDYPVWSGTEGAARVLLVDLDNLRAVKGRLRARLSVVVELARQADHVTLAGQVGAVARSRPWLAEFAPRAKAVAAGPDVADHVLLAAAAEVPDPAEFLVVSNDGIFADLAERGELTILSPGVDALSDRLHGAASLLVDLAALEQEAAALV
ncbi:hypothetical protein MO973_00815 [Paenibacillus sp. TRM 82003]|uniref:hypothetical protein n=1 Tax=Kineococcus sp. TRM81007 TaxID=2925831 RepID=UPI001F55EA75|nr:hypothetical protein [Kineococcus sp. TRM81007]MCI2239403.1 hypothetical protein [Kineococcus sp. TRM81007]MCI3918773.1 hypothetical protein [Paenibacillus sp. TRM 82003]